MRFACLFTQVKIARLSEEVLVARQIAHAPRGDEQKSICGKPFCVDSRLNRLIQSRRSGSKHNQWGKHVSHARRLTPVFPAWWLREPWIGVRRRFSKRLLGGEILTPPVEACQSEISGRHCASFLVGFLPSKIPLLTRLSWLEPTASGGS